MKILKATVAVSLGVGGCVLFNQAGADPTRGALQNDPALCAYGYNPNCGAQSMGANTPPLCIMSQPLTKLAKPRAMVAGCANTVISTRGFAL